VQIIKTDNASLRDTADNYLETLQRRKEQTHVNNPQILDQLRSYEILTDSLERHETERFTTLRKISKIIEKLLKDCGYFNVRLVTHKTRFLHLKFMHNEFQIPEGIPCTLFVHNVLPLQSTDLLNAYMSIDKSNKIRDFLHVIKLFVKSHRICDASAGFLSSYAW
jgi:hypothetical protein